MEYKDKSSPESNTAAEFERQRKRKVLLVGIVLGALCFLFLWQLFGTRGHSSEHAAGINATVPEGRAQATEGDKRKAAERVRMEERQEGRMQTLGDDAFSLLDDGLRPATQERSDEDPADRAAQANRALHDQMRGFYTPPARNAEVDALREQLASLQAQLDARPAHPAPLHLAEEQYRLARKYLGNERSEGPAPQRARAARMRPLRERDVAATTLNPQADSTAERNRTFLTPESVRHATEGDAVRACIASTQVVRAGSIVCLRLLEAARIDDAVIPRNTTIYGTAAIDGMRLRIVVQSLRIEGRIYTLDAVAYDLDGLPGLNVPDTKERRTLKDALAAAGQTVGTSVNVTRSTGQAVLSELTRGTVQASSRYLSEKLQEVTITLKANHQLLLLSKDN